MCTYQHKFAYTYLFGAFSPINGNHLVRELPQYNSNKFQTFLEHLNPQDEQKFKIVVLENGAFHHAKSLVVPPNIALLFLPPYAPELNPAEKAWWMIKRELKMKLFMKIEDLQEALTEAVKKVCTTDAIRQLTAFACYQNLV